MMLFRYSLGRGGPVGMVGCGTVLILMGLLFISPFIAILIKALGWFFVALGVMIAALGLLTWIMGSKGDRIEPL